MAERTISHDNLRKLAFKEVVGTSIGALTVGALVGSIGFYRTRNIKNFLKGAAGGTAMGFLGFLASGVKVYDETIGLLQSQSFATRMEARTQQAPQRPGRG